jgi:transglutaminase-like putative cysteine protease
LFREKKRKNSFRLSLLSPRKTVYYNPASPATIADIQLKDRCFYFEYVDKHTESVPEEALTSPDTLATYLVSPWGKNLILLCFVLFYFVVVLFICCYLHRFANFTINPILGNDDLMKVRAIFKWICNNIRFDTEAFWEDKPTYTDPKDVIKHRVTVAKGYANLFAALAKKASLQVTI